MKEIAESLDLPEGGFDITGTGDFPSAFAVTDLATAAYGYLGASLAGLIGQDKSRPNVTVDRRLASLWYAQSIHPFGWELPPVWDALAGVYETRDGWVRLHTNLPHHKAAALRVLGCEPDLDAVQRAIRSWGADEVETSIVAEGGVAAMMRSEAEWAAHPQGAAVAAEPLIQWSNWSGPAKSWDMRPDRPLSGLKVLDLTRVLAGPVSTRTLAGYGAEVLRIDPPGWDEPNLVPDITLGKRCARLDLRHLTDRGPFEALLAEADILIHGYRPGALAGLGYDEATRRDINPGLIEVTLDAYGWTGPWAGRRGFDSLVQMSCGIADTGRVWAASTKPTPLPVQALDHATGYLMAAAAVRLLDRAARGKGIGTARLSLARTAELLKPYRQDRIGTLDKRPEQADLSPETEYTPWGAAFRLRPALTIEGAPMKWDRPASALGSVAASW
ncbi:CoA transferase [Marivivens marinus]|uniref:CoA transferase n=1 Tax=Marivivens marinus TaxID=3110173 RepID=UPI003B84A619